MNKNMLRRKITNIFLYSAITLFAAGLVFFTKETSKSASDGVKLCVNVLIPSLFPFFVISSLAVQTGFAEAAGRLFARPMHALFKLPGQCAPAFILGLVGGYPVGAKTAITLYEQKLCTREQAQRLLSFCNNSGPAFILGAVGTAIFGTAKAGALLYAAHILASVTVGIISGLFAKDAPHSAGYAGFTAVPIGRAFTTAVTSSFSSILNICAFVIFFAVSIKLLFLLGVIPFLARAIAPFAGGAACAESVISGLFEVTTGINSLLLATAGVKTKLTMSAFMLGWAGLSVHFQVLNFIGESGLSALPYILGKLAHGVFSALYVFLLLSLFPLSLAITTSAIDYSAQLSTMTLQGSFFLSLTVCLGFWVAITLLSMAISQINHCKTRKKHL